MRRIVSFLVAVFLMSGASAANPISGFLYYEAPQAPVGGDCNAIAAAIGAEATWRGEFSGTRIADFNDYRYPYSARGCFKSEYACRVWQNAALSYLGRGFLVATTCRRGVGGY